MTRLEEGGELNSTMATIVYIYTQRYLHSQSDLSGPAFSYTLGLPAEIIFIFFSSSFLLSLYF
jgi:hypothetical protein